MDTKSETFIQSPFCTMQMIINPVFQLIVRVSSALIHFSLPVDLCTATSKSFIVYHCF